jgi:hypothetical protein
MGDFNIDSLLEHFDDADLSPKTRTRSGNYSTVKFIPHPPREEKSQVQVNNLIISMYSMRSKVEPV